MTLEVIDIAKALIACPSVTPKEAGVLDVLSGYLEPLGFTIWRETFHEDGYENVENLYARLGTGSPNLCFAGHTDVVPAGDESAWDSPPFEPTVKEGYLYGRGAEDMKGAIAAFVAAVSRFKETGIWDSASGSISFLITGDEEGIAINGTRKMLDWLKGKGEQIDHCLVGEPTNPNHMGEMIKIGRRGSALFDVTVRGMQGHVAYPDRADNPIPRLIEILYELEHHPLDKGTEFFPPSNLEITTVDVQNSTDNLIPAAAHARFNIRFNDLHSGASLEKWATEICRKHDENVELNCRISGEAFRNHDETLTQAVVAAVKKVTGHTPALSTTGGTSDARFIKDVCPVIECGTTGRTAHAVNENVSLKTLEQLAEIYTAFLANYFAAPD